MLLWHSSALYIDKNYIHCFIPTKLCRTKHIILSATADEEIYKMHFYNRKINFITCKEAKFRGRLIQNCSRSYSRRDLDNDSELLKNIVSEHEDFEYIITFMKYESQFNDQKIHFGNTEGCDFMRGNNILVIGTPHLSEFVYKLFALHIGLDVDQEMRFQEVEEDSYKYWFHTYSDPNLRTIQLWFLRTELIQAVGRARLLRYDCTVKLYANLPLIRYNFFRKLKKRKR